MIITTKLICSFLIIFSNFKVIKISQKYNFEKCSYFNLKRNLILALKTEIRQISFPAFWMVFLNPFIFCFFFWFFYRCVCQRGLKNLLFPIELISKGNYQFLYMGHAQNASMKQWSFHFYLVWNFSPMNLLCRIGLYFLNFFFWITQLLGQCKAL